MVISILNPSLTASPTPDEAAVALKDARSFPLDLKTDRAAGAGLNVTNVNMFITKQISLITAMKISDVTSVQMKITSSLQLTYGNQFNWLVYLIKNLSPPTFPDPDVSLNYFGDGASSKVSVKPWTVYWSATTVSPTDLQLLTGNEDVIRTRLVNCPSTIGGQFAAATLYKCLSNSPITSGRPPISTFISLSSKLNANEVSIGSSPRLNTYFLGIRIKLDIEISFKIFGAQVNISIHRG